MFEINLKKYLKFADTRQYGYDYYTVTFCICVKAGVCDVLISHVININFTEEICFRNLYENLYINFPIVDFFSVTMGFP